MMLFNNNYNDIIYEIKETKIFKISAENSEHLKMKN